VGVGTVLVYAVVAIPGNRSVQSGLFEPEIAILQPPVLGISNGMCMAFTT
jgi:hypothetical protein